MLKLQLRNLEDVETYLRNAIETSEKVIQNFDQLLRRSFTCQFREALQSCNSKI